jgi:hypothetical protein
MRYSLPFEPRVPNFLGLPTAVLNDKGRYHSQLIVALR